MDANERYEKIKQLIDRRETLVNEIDGELAALFSNNRATEHQPANVRSCSVCGLHGHNAKTCPTKEKGTTLSADPIV